MWCTSYLPIRMYGEDNFINIGNFESYFDAMEQTFVVTSDKSMKVFKQFHVNDIHRIVFNIQKITESHKQNNTYIRFVLSKKKGIDEYDTFIIIPKNDNIIDYMEGLLSHKSKGIMIFPKENTDVDIMIEKHKITLQESIQELNENDYQ